jgi:hypothetical protein
MKGSVLTSRTWLLLITAALLIAAGALNFSQRLRFQPPPTDGVTWIDAAQGVVAKTVEPGSAGARARIIPGDQLLAISMSGRKCEDVARGTRCEQVAKSQDVQIYLDSARVGGEIHYLIERPSYPAETRIYYADLDNLGAIQNWTARDAYINLIGLVFLCVGLFVVFKQGGRAPFVLRLATAFLAAFVFCFYTPIGTYKDLDLAIAFLRSAGLIMFAPLFLHFSAIYPVRYQLFEERRWRSVLLYVPALVLLGVATLIFFRGELLRLVPSARLFLNYSPEFVARFYKASFIHFTAALVASVALLIRRFVISKNTVARQQLKWVVWGAVLAIVPFILF